MPTCRVCIAEAMRALRALAPGDDPSADDLAVGLEAIGDLVADIHEARGPLLDVDVTANVTPSENQRLRVQLGSTINVTLPNAVPIWGAWDPYDYGFSAPTQLWPPPVGTTGPADGVQWRAPRDGARIEVVGTTQGLWFYRADINTWTAAYGLTVDAEIPFNARYKSAFAALLAERLADVVAQGEPTPGLAARIAAGHAALMLRTGAGRDPVRAEYF